MSDTSIYASELREWDLNSAFHRGDSRHPYRVWFWKHVLASFHMQLDGNIILEVGCGAGFLTTLVSRKNNTVYGVDFSPRMIQAAQSVNSRARFQVAPAHRLPFKNSMFHTVIAAMLFHHLTAQDLLLPSVREMSRVLKKNGVFCILDHSGNVLSNGTLLFFNTARILFMMGKGQFSGSGSSHEVPFNGNAFVNSLANDFTRRTDEPISTIFFQFFSTCSHTLEYLFGENIAISFEKRTLPLVILIEEKFSHPWLCTEVAITLVKK